jgi:hypothetical protein
VVKKNGCADTFTINEAMEVLKNSLRGHGLGRFNLSITCHMPNSEESADTAGTVLAGETGQAIAEQNKQPQPVERTAEDGTDEPPAWLAGTAGARQPAAKRNVNGSVRRRLF